MGRLEAHLSKGELRYNDAVITQFVKEEGFFRPAAVSLRSGPPASGEEARKQVTGTRRHSVVVGHQLDLDEHARVDQPGYLDHRRRRPGTAERLAVGAADLL